MITPATVDRSLLSRFPLPSPKRFFLAGCLALGLMSGSNLALAQDAGTPLPPPLNQTPIAPPQFQPLPPALPPGTNAMETPAAGAPGLHPEVASMPGVNSEISVIQHRSQLIVTRSRIVQIAVADPSIIDVVQHSPTEISTLGQSIGSTTLTIWFEKNPEPLIYLVKTVRDSSLDDQSRIDYGRLERKLALLFPNSKVYLIPLSGKIVVKGQARDSVEAANILQIIRGEVINQTGGLYGPGNFQQVGAAYAAGRGTAGDLASSNIINMLQIPGDFQIMLRVVIAELKRSDLRNMAADIAVSINGGENIFASALGGAPGTISAILSGGDAAILINAIHTNQSSKILAEPSVVTLSGHDATILSGGEFAVPTIVGIQGASGQQTVFRGFGVSLVVTPVITDKDNIRMRIRPEFSELNQGIQSANGTPGLNTRRVDTTVELREGQTIVLGGLFSNQSLTSNSRIPYLSAIPLIGPALFANKKSNQDETELLILVTPEIVRPLEPDEVPPVPGFEVTVPDDNNLYLRGMTQGPNDSNVYQLAPYGHGSGTGIPVGHGQVNPAPSSPGYAPIGSQNVAPPQNMAPPMTDPSSAYPALPPQSSRYGTMPQASPPNTGSRTATPPTNSRPSTGRSFMNGFRSSSSTTRIDEVQTQATNATLPSKPARTIGGLRRNATASQNFTTQAGYNASEETSQSRSRNGWGR
ncbi:MAG: pilus assembly protein N-terminal domain-containing protein [Planctomycetales bacterium]